MELEIARDSTRCSSNADQCTTCQILFHASTVNLTCTQCACVFVYASDTTLNFVQGWRCPEACKNSPVLPMEFTTYIIDNSFVLGPLENMNKLWLVNFMVNYIYYFFFNFTRADFVEKKKQYSRSSLNLACRNFMSKNNFKPFNAKHFSIKPNFQFNFRFLWFFFSVVANEVSRFERQKKSFGDF